MARDDKTANNDARRFREIALPHLDGVYTFAFFLMGNRKHAEAAVQQCYLQAMRHVSDYRSHDVKQRLLAIVRTICHAELARLSGSASVNLGDRAETAEAALLALPSPASPTRCIDDSATIRQHIKVLPVQVREVLVLRDLNELPYDQIADIVGASRDAVMSRLTRARAMLLATSRDRQCA